MSPGDRHHLSILWITLQFLFAIIDSNRQAMALLTPYVSEFRYSPDSHPSKNPNCPKRWTRRSWEQRRSPDEGEPVGQEPSIEIRAVLVRCPKSPDEMVEIPVTGNAYNISAGRSKDILEFHGFDRDEPAHHSEVKNCRRKLVVTMKFNNVGKTRTREEFVVVDHVLDPVTMRKARLLNPFVFKVRQEQVLQLYGLKFQSVVNGEAKEEVINKKWSNYTGCDDSLVNPTCGQMMFDGKPIPYSQGFCCSCDPDVNSARQSTARSNIPRLGTSQKLIPTTPEENRMLGYDDAGSNGMFAHLFASKKTDGEKFRNEVRVRQEKPKSEETIFERERSLESPGGKIGSDGREKEKEEEEEEEEEGDRGFRSAVNSPSKGKIEPYIEAVREESSIENNPRRNLEVKPFHDYDGGKFYPKFNSSYKNGDVFSPRKRKTTDLNAEIVELENEYEESRNSRKKVASRRGADLVFKNHSKCIDFRKLARDRAKHFDFLNTSSSDDANVETSQDLKPVNSEMKHELRRSEIETRGDVGRRKVAGNVTSVTTSRNTFSTTSKESFRTITPPDTISTSFFSSGLSVTKISSNNTEAISTPESISYPALILREKLVNDELYSPLKLNNRFVKGKKRLSVFSKDLRASRRLENSSNVNEDRYADWVIKYAKMHSNRFIDTPQIDVGSEFEENSSPNRSLDTLNEIAEKAMKKFELEGEKDESLRSDKGNNEESSSLIETSSNIENENENRIVGNRVSRTAKKSWKEKMYENGEKRDIVHGLDDAGATNKLIKKSIKDELRSSREDPGPKIVSYLRKVGKENSEPAIIMRGIGDMVKGNYRYEDKSATVIADHRYNEPMSSTEQDYIFLDENGREKGCEERSKLRVNQSRGDLTNFKSVAMNNPEVRSMGRKIEDALLSNRPNEDESMYKKLNRLDSLVENGLRSRRRSFRSVAYDDPFDRNRDEKDAKIDEEIEKEFIEISEALRESSENDKKIGELSSNNFREDKMLRELAMMFNEIPKVDLISKEKKIVEKGIGKLSDPRVAGNDGDEIGEERFGSNSKELVSLGSSQEGSRFSSGEITGQKIGDMALPDARFSSWSETGRRNYKTIKPLTARSSTNKYRRGSDVIGLEESQTNINEIVKEIIKNDYKTSPSSFGKGGFSKAKKKVTRFHTFDKRNKNADEKDDKKSRKRDEETTSAGTVLVLRESETMEPELTGMSTIVPTEISPGTFVSVSMNVETVTASVEGSLSAVTTPRITGVKNDLGNTGSELLDTEVMIISKEMTTARSSSIKSSSSSSGINVGEKYSLPVNERPDESIKSNTSSSNQVMSEEHEGEEEEEKEDFSGKKFASSFEQLEDERNDEAILGVEKLQLNKAVKEPRRVYNEQDEITGRTIVGKDGEKLMMVVSRESIENREIDMRNERATTPIEKTTNNREQTTTGYKETIKEYETTSESDSIVVEYVTAESRESVTTPRRGITSGNENSDTRKPESVGVGVTSELQRSETSDLGKTSAAVTKGVPNLQTLKSLREETPRGSLSRGEIGKTRVVLTKTYSVSHDPGTFMDNYEFPVGVKRILLKKFDSPTVTPILDLNLFPHIRNVDEFVINGKEYEDDRRNFRARDTAKGKMRKVDIVHDPSNDINKPVAIPYIEDKHSTTVDPNPTMNESVREKANVGRTLAHKFIRNYGPEDTRLFTTRDSVLSGEETTHFSFDNDDVNATNYQRDFAMEQPIFAEQTTEKKIRNQKDKLGGGVEFFYDYDQESNSREVNSRVRKSFGIHSRNKRSNEKDMELDNLVKRFRNGVSKTEHGSVGNSETKECDERGLAIVNREALCSEQRLGESNISESVDREEKREIETGVEAEFDDVPEVKWRDKMDQLKLKKHEEILKEYLNWNPKVDTTVVKIFSSSSTIKVSHTTEKMSKKEERELNSLPRKILVIENKGENKLGREKTKLKKSRKIDTRNIIGRKLGEGEMLEKVMKLPRTDDGEIAISVREKMNKNPSRGGERPWRETTDGKNDRSVESVNLESREDEEGFERRERNIKFTRREARSRSLNQRNGRRLMSAYQLGENADNEKRKEENEDKEERDAIRKDDEALLGDEDLPLRGNTSSFDYLDSSYKKLKRDKLKSNWDQLVDKVIVNNNNKDSGNDPSSKKRRSNERLEEIRLGNGRTAMEKLHFFDADKYVRIMANKISRLSNADNREENLGALNRGAKSREKLDEKVAFSEEDQIDGNRDGKSAIENVNDDDDDDDYHEPEVKATDDEKLMKTFGDYGEEIPYERESRLVENSPVNEDSIFGKLGSDFEISISGKVHINGGVEGQPMSLSIEGVSVDNATLTSTAFSSSSPSPSLVNQDVASRKSNNKKESVFGIARSSVPQNVTEIQPKRDFIVADKTDSELGDVPEVMRAMHVEKTSPEMYQLEGSKPLVSPRKTFYDVRVKARPGYEKWLGHSPQDFSNAGESSGREVDGDLEKNSVENLTNDEPVFDFAKLELRRPKSLTRGIHFPRRHHRRFRQERRATSRGRSGDSEKVKRFDESIFVEPLVEVIPKESLSPFELSNAEPEREKIPVKKFNEQSKVSGDLDGREDRVEELEDARRNFDDADTTGAKQAAVEPAPEKEKDKLFHDLVVSGKKHAEKIGEPCYAAEPEIRYMKIPKTNSLVKNMPEKVLGELEKARLSTDDLHSSSSSKAGDKTAGGETLLKGVEVSSPGESDPRLREHRVDVGARKEIELKNLMRMIKFVKKMENLVPRYEDESEVIEDGPEAVVKIESILLLPENISSIEVEGSKELERSKPSSERVVEIGEGVRHKVAKNKGRGKDKIADFIILENPTGVESTVVDRDVNGIVNKERGSSSTLHENIVPKNGEANGEGEGNNEFQNGSNISEFFENVGKQMSDRLEYLDSEKRSANENSWEKKMPNLYNVRINGESDVSKGKNHRSSEILRSISDSEQRVFRGGLRDDSNNVEKKLGGYSNGVSRSKKLDEGNESGERVVGSKRNDVDRVDLYDVGIAEDPEEKEGLVSLGYTPRQNSELDRKARTPVSWAFGVADEDPTLVENNETRKDLKKKRRRTKNLTKKKRAGGVTRSVKKSRRSHKKKKKKKKKKMKNNKVKMETGMNDGGNKKKKINWWPFKRNLLAIIEDEESVKKSTNYVHSIRKKSKTIGDQSSSRRKKRQIKSGGTQARGGQDCMDRRHPPHVNSAKYQESAHCLRFSDLWYSVYQLENPIMEHTVYLQLFEKHTLSDGSTHWDDLTHGSMVRLGTFVRHQRDAAPTIAFTYSGAKIVPQNQGHSLNPAKDRLLVPSPVPAKKLEKYPEVKGGSGEYLIVESSSINREGNECDKAGVGFSTFATQPNRCGKPKGTCLKNQPLAYWRHDVEAREAGRPGCYFLSNFASVPNNPIKYNVSGSGSREYLGLEYHSTHVSAIDVEVKADYNAIVRVGSSGRITEVHIDSTAPEHTIVTIVISNMGLASSPYQSRISDCPTGLPVSWRRAKGAMQVIPPQHDLRVTLDLYGQLFVNGFHCSVEVVNHHGELVAMRRIRVQRMDRCFCVWHCLCACIGSVAGLRCQAMSPEHYHAAGFQGPVPVSTMESSIISNAIKDVMTFSALVILILLALGMIKWFVGVFLPSVSRRGLDVLLDGTRFDGYFETELQCRCIVTDIEGNIVHPDTGDKSVRICSRKAEFFLNLIFFLTYPIAVCCKFSKNSFLSRRDSSCCQDESKICLLREDTCLKRDRPELICVNTYGESRNSKMEAEDTRYVMNELKRSRDSLQYGIKRSKDYDLDLFRE